MKLSCTQENLNRGINNVIRSVGTRTTLPVLSNILLKTDKGRLKISATDLELGVSSWIGAKIEKEGALTIPSRLLSEFVSSNNDKKIDLEVEDTTLNLKSEHFQAHIKGIEASEFPLIPEISKEPIFKIPTLIFKEAVLQTVFAAAYDETRPVLSGVLLRLVGDKLKLVATDSYRLSEKTLNLPRKISKDLDLIVPAKTLSELYRITQDDQEQVSVSVSENQIQFTLPSTQIVSRLIEGSFPDYQPIIPKTSSVKVAVKTADFQNAIKMASFFARESANNIRLKILPQKIQVIAISPQLGDNTSEVEAKVEGGELEIAFNAKFVLDVLPVLGSSEINLEFSGKLSPGVLRTKTGSDFLYIIMPLRLEE